MIIKALLCLSALLNLIFGWVLFQENKHDFDFAVVAWFVISIVATGGYFLIERIIL